MQACRCVNSSLHASAVLSGKGVRYRPVLLGKVQTLGEVEMVVSFLMVRDWKHDAKALKRKLAYELYLCFQSKEERSLCLTHPPTRSARNASKNH